MLLFDTGSAWSRLDEWKADLWTVAGIPAPPGDHETNETIVFGYLVAWFLGEVSLLSDPADDSSFLTRHPKLSLLISTNGWRELHSPFAENVASMSPQSSRPMPLCLDDTCVLDQWTSTTISSTLMSITKPANEESITDIA